MDRFVDAAIEQSQKGRTENLATTYLTASDPRIDFFFKVLEDTNDNVTIDLLEKSWNFNCLDTLRLIAYLRDIRSGKSIRYQYYVCLYWLYEHHPRTLIQNFNILINCGYWKDPLQLLMVILFKGKISSYLFQEEFNENSRKNHLIKSKKQLIKKLKDKETPQPDKKEINELKASFYCKVSSEANENLVKHFREEINKKYRPLLQKRKFVDSDEDVQGDADMNSVAAAGDVRSETRLVREVEIVRERKANNIDSKYLKELKMRYARERFNEDKKYRFFHLKFAELIAKQLIEDEANLKANNFKKISLAAKWAPSLNGHFDKYTLIGSSIALQIAKLMRDQEPSLETIFSKPIPIATYLARKHYQKSYIVKLREQIRIPERFMCANEWNVLPYQMVPSKCMQRNRKLFMRHDHDRFEQFVKSRDKISGATLKPPELVSRAMKLTNDEELENKELEKELLEKQWNSLKDSIKLDNEDTCFKSALSVCDVSGSMDGVPMQAAIGLTLMTMSFTNEPWSNICVTFSEEPQFVHFEKNQTLYQKVNHLTNQDAGLSTDLTKTFELILKLAKKHELKQNEMPKYLFIFSDMEFDAGNVRSLLTYKFNFFLLLLINFALFFSKLACKQEETNYEEAKRLFAEAGYELPTIVFWNLRDSKSVPIQKNEQGTILLSGYSAQQLGLLINKNIDQITPFMFIEDVLSMKKYEDLVVID